MHTDQTAPGSHAMPPLPRFLVAVLPVVAVAVSASLITQPNIPTYARLACARSSASENGFVSTSATIGHRGRGRARAGRHSRS